MLVLDIQKILVTAACLLLTWLLINTALLLKDRQRLKKYVRCCVSLSCCSVQ